MKIAPTNQSLILASDPGGSRGAQDPLLGPGSRVVAGGVALKRVTILASRSDATVVVQADYFPRDEAAAAAASSVAPAVDAQLPEILVPANDASIGRPATMSPYRNPIELYTRTQRGFDGATRTALLDVLA